MFGFKKKNYLKRTDFINSVDSNKIWSKTMKIPEIIGLLEKLETEISKYEYDIDKNFIMNSRRKILKREIEERLQKNDGDINEIISESLFNFWEFVGDEYPGGGGGILLDCQELGISIKEFYAMDKAYREKGIICLQEKDVILEMIRELKEQLKIEINNEKVKVNGWDAITMEAERVYPNQKNPKHYGAMIKWKFGGPDPLDGISIYDGGNYWHFVTYGLSELYDKETSNKDYSGYGMEFTLKLKKDNYDNEEAEIKCICGILQQIAKITFTNGEIFKPYEYLYTGQTVGIDSKQKSNITGFITIPDTNLKPIDTENGKVIFVEFIGATNDELLALKNKKLTVEELYKKYQSDITDYNRQSVI